MLGADVNFHSSPIHMLFYLVENQECSCQTWVEKISGEPWMPKKNLKPLLRYFSLDQGYQTCSPGARSSPSKDLIWSNRWIYKVWKIVGSSAKRLTTQEKEPAVFVALHCNLLISNPHRVSIDLHVELKWNCTLSYEISCCSSSIF